MLRLPLTFTVLALAEAVSWGLAPGFAWAQEHAPAPPAARAMEKPKAAPAKPTAAPARPRVTTPIARRSQVQAPRAQAPAPAQAQAQKAPQAPAEAAETHQHSSPLHNRPPAPAIRAAVREFVARRPPVSAATPASVSAPRYVVSWPTRKVTLNWPAVPERTTLTWPLASSAPVDLGRGLDSAPSAISTGRPR